MTLSAWVLVLVLGGFDDRSMSMTTIDMPQESVCLAAANKARSDLRHLTVQAFCINREASK
jgi:hypothetical protein